MIDIEQFLISLRNHKNSDGLRHPIYLADNLQEEIKIIQDAIKHSRREWVGLEQSDMPDGEDPIYDDPRFIAGMVWAAKKLMKKNGI